MNYKKKAIFTGLIGILIGGLLFTYTITNADNIAYQQTTRNYYILSIGIVVVFALFAIALYMRGKNKEALMSPENLVYMDLIHISRESGIITNMLMKYDINGVTHYYYGMYEDSSGYTTDDLIKEVRNHNGDKVPVYVLPDRPEKFFIDIDGFIKTNTLSIKMDLSSTRMETDLKKFEEYPLNIKNTEE